MTAKQSPAYATQSGNATIYILIVIALFAALTLILARQNDTSESSRLDQDRLRILTTQIMAYPLQVKQALDMLTASGTHPDDIDFTMAHQTGFNTDPNYNKVFHPDGAGLVRATLPDDAITTAVVTPVAGWYLGRFNNVEWSESPAQDIMLVAYPLKAELCASINKTITGSDTIPPLGATIPNTFIADEYPTGTTIHGGPNADFETSDCTACENQPSLCVRDSASNYGFYSLLISR